MYLHQLNVIGQFKPGKGDRPDVYQTRNGCHPWALGCGIRYGNRTILAEEYFDLDIETELRLSLHESYHPGRDYFPWWSAAEQPKEENRAYRYALEMLEKPQETQAFQEYLARLRQGGRAP
jgi:hypothetical protein